MSPEDMSNAEGRSWMVTNCVCVRVYGSPHVRRAYHCMRIIGLSESRYKYGNAAATHTVVSHQSQTATVSITCAWPGCHRMKRSARQAVTAAIFKRGCAFVLSSSNSCVTPATSGMPRMILYYLNIKFSCSQSPFVTF